MLESSSDDMLIHCFLNRLMFSIGLIFGPVLGGFLTNPATQFPELFGKIQFLHENPYFLPCLVSAFISLVGFAIGFFYLEETLSSRNPRDSTSTLVDDSECTNAPTETTSLLGKGLTSRIPQYNHQSSSSSISTSRCSISNSTSALTNSNEETAGRITIENSLHDEFAHLDLSINENDSLNIKSKSIFSGITSMSVITIFGYGLIAFINIIFDEVLSL